MKRPAVFFDRDNTLIVSNGYLGDPAKVELVEGAAEAIARARRLGFAVVVFSNQSGVARGMFGEDDVQAVNARMDQLLRTQNAHAVVDRHEYCPDHPEAEIKEYRSDSDRRKPGMGMIRDAAEALALDLSRSWVIGDAPRDIEAGKAAGCRTILFRDPKLIASPAAEEESDAEPEHTAASLREAIDIVQRDNLISRPPTDTVEPPEPPQAVRLGRIGPEPSASPNTKLEALAEQMLFELRRANEPPIADFSITKMLAGIAQVVSVAMVFLAYLYKSDVLLWFAIWVQCLTIALLVMGRQG